MNLLKMELRVLCNIIGFVLSLAILLSTLFLGFYVEFAIIYLQEVGGVSTIALSILTIIFWIVMDIIMFHIMKEKGLVLSCFFSLLQVVLIGLFIISRIHLQEAFKFDLMDVPFYFIGFQAILSIIYTIRLFLLKKTTK